MNNPLVRESIEFKRTANGKVLRCIMQICRDGSVYLNGDDIELGFEESSTSEEEATHYLTARGYTKC